MSKERLEEIKHYYREMESFDPGTQSDINWLIEQAERAQELEGMIDRIRFVNSDYDRQNKRYREAVEKSLDELRHGCKYHAQYVLEKAMEESE